MLHLSTPCSPMDYRCMRLRLCIVSQLFVSLFLVTATFEYPVSLQKAFSIMSCTLDTSFSDLCGKVCMLARV